MLLLFVYLYINVLMYNLIIDINILKLPKGNCIFILNRNKADLTVLFYQSLIIIYILNFFLNTNELNFLFC